jgi:hypothetical protein
MASSHGMHESTVTALAWGVTALALVVGWHACPTELLSSDGCSIKDGSTMAAPWRTRCTISIHVPRAPYAPCSRCTVDMLDQVTAYCLLGGLDRGGPARWRHRGMGMEKP